jgi:hypothetical protein
MKLVREIPPRKLKNKDINTGQQMKKFCLRRNNSYYKTQIWNKKTTSKDPKTNFERK